MSDFFGNFRKPLIWIKFVGLRKIDKNRIDFEIDNSEFRVKYACKVGILYKLVVNCWNFCKCVHQAIIVEVTIEMEMNKIVTFDELMLISVLDSADFKISADSAE